MWRLKFEYELETVPGCGGRLDWRLKGGSPRVSQRERNTSSVGCMVGTEGLASMPARMWVAAVLMGPKFVQSGRAFPRRAEGKLKKKKREKKRLSSGGIERAGPWLKKANITKRLQECMCP